MVSIFSLLQTCKNDAANEVAVVYYISYTRKSSAEKTFSSYDKRNRIEWYWRATPHTICDTSLQFQRSCHTVSKSTNRNGQHLDQTVFILTLLFCGYVAWSNVYGTVDWVKVRILPRRNDIASVSGNQFRPNWTSVPAKDTSRQIWTQSYKSNKPYLKRNNVTAILLRTATTRTQRFPALS